MCDQPQVEMRTFREVIDDLQCKPQLVINVGQCEEVVKGRVLSVNKETGQITFELDTELSVEEALERGRILHLMWD